MESDRTKWNRRYASAPWYLGKEASPFLRETIDWIEKLVPGRRALDVAAGECRNSLFLARRGFAVTAVDISDVGIDKGREVAAREALPVTFVIADLETDPLPPGPFDLILNVNYLQREMIGEEVSRLTPGGILLFDTIREPQGGVPEGHDPSFFLGSGEIVRLFDGLAGEILLHQELSGNPMPTARALFRKTP